MAVLFDTLEFVHELRPASSQEQAEALATAVAGSAQDTIASKSDIAALKVDLARWIVGAIAFNFVATAALIITAMKLFN